MAETNDAANDSIESRQDVDDKPLSSKFWLGEIKAALKRSETWTQRADKVVARYRDERNLDRTAASERRTNILWSNTETLKSALFSGLGKPDVRRRFQKHGPDDRTSRQAALLLERGLAYCADAYDAEAQVDACVEDQLLPGRGTGWVVYEADVEEYGETQEGDADTDDGADAKSDEGATDQSMAQMGAMGSMVKTQSVRFDHVYWKDYLSSAGRKWTDIWWVARGHDYSRDELTKYFPKHADEIPLTNMVSGFEAASRQRAKKEDEDTFKRARVWEIWDKSKKQRIYVAQDYKFILKADEDPYKLRDFFPTVEPLYGVKTTSSLDPVPEYTLYQDQAEELDQVQTRLTRLIDALRRRGVYDASADGPDNQLAQIATAADNEFLPYRNFAVLAEKGGLKNVFQTEDLAPIIEVVDKLQQHRVQLVQTIYEITGISDIMRGASNANETATAQRIKGQFGSMRLQKRQKRVQVFVRDLYRLKAEIIAEHFTREQLQDMTGIDLPLRAEQAMAKQQLDMLQQQMQQAQMAAKQGLGAVQVPQPDPKMVQQMIATTKAVPWEDIADIIRSDQRRGYKIDIDTDALSRMDDEEEKTQRIEFMKSMQEFMQLTMPAVMQMPALAPLAKETASFAVGAFKVGRQMEEAFEDTFSQIEEMAKAQMAKGPQPSPEERKVQMDAQAREQELQFKAKEAEADRQIKQQEFEHSAKMKEAEFAHATQLEERKMQNQQMLAERQMEIDRELKAAQFEHQRAMSAEQMAADRERADWERHFKQSEISANFELEDLKLSQAKELEGGKQQFEREKHQQSMDFEREKSGVDAGNDQASPINTLIKVITQSQNQQSQTFVEALDRLTQQTAESLMRHEKMMALVMAPKRMVKDPKTGEKRVEVVTQ